MKKRIIFSLIFIMFLSTCNISYANKENGTIVLKNKLFALTVPYRIKGIFKAEIKKDSISIYDKTEKHNGANGYAFGIKAYKTPSDHANIPGEKKIGELTDKNGDLYDIVLKRPIYIQTDNIKAPLSETYGFMYFLGNIAKIEGVNGSKYYKHRGTQGDKLYRNILEKHITAINEKWNSEKLEKENMSYMHNVLGQNNKNAMDKIGYTFYDINSDGIDELLIGEIAQGQEKGIIYDMYTMVDREPRHVISQNSRNRYFVCDDVFICNEYLNKANEKEKRIYILSQNSTELLNQDNLNYKEYTYAKSPWFMNAQTPWFNLSDKDMNNEKINNISEKMVMRRNRILEKYKRFDFTPLSQASQSLKSFYDRFNPQKAYHDYFSVLKEFPQNYYYTTVKINKSKEQILIITDNVDDNKNAYHGFFYYLAKNSFVYPLGYLESKQPFAKSENYIYMTKINKTLKLYISDKKSQLIKTKTENNSEETHNIEFKTIKEQINTFAE